MDKQWLLLGLVISMAAVQGDLEIDPIRETAIVGYDAVPAMSHLYSVEGFRSDGIIGFNQKGFHPFKRIDYELRPIGEWKASNYHASFSMELVKITTRFFIFKKEESVGLISSDANVWSLEADELIVYISKIQFDGPNDVIYLNIEVHSLKPYNIEGGDLVESLFNSGLSINDPRDSEPNVPPGADADGPYMGFEGSLINLDGSGSYEEDGTIDEYEWDLDGDGEYGDANGRTVRYAWCDDYDGNIRLRVTDDRGASDVNTTTARILNVAPAVEAGADQEVWAGDTVSFNAGLVDPGSCDSHTIDWNFGDGTASTGTLTISHVYYIKGVYIVTLAVADDDGGADSDTLEVAVEPIPAAIDFSPGTLHTDSQSNVNAATVLIELPEGYDHSLIDVGSVVLSTELGSVSAQPEPTDNGARLMVKFERQAVIGIVDVGNVEITVTGAVFYNGGNADFEGSDTIIVS